jgi:methylglutaconyl-CoA hydratase
MKKSAASARVLTQRDDYGNLTVTLNRPEVHNAFDPEMVASLTGVLEDISADDSIRAVVIAGAGKSFCAGADIGHMRQSAKFTKAQNQKNASVSARMFHLLYTLNKPTVAAVHGAVRGGGCGIVAACDIAIAARTATFRLSEVKIGIIPSMISPYVIAAIGERYARRYMLSGEEFDCAEAWRIGLVHDLVEEEELGTRVGEGHACGQADDPDQRAQPDRT